MKNNTGEASLERQAELSAVLELIAHLYRLTPYGDLQLKALAQSVADRSASEADLTSRILDHLERVRELEGDRSLPR